jgi:DNA topoisomerase IB
VRQPKDLRSRFDMKQEAKRLKQYADEDERLRQQEQARIAVIERQ